MKSTNIIKAPYRLDADFCKKMQDHTLVSIDLNENVVLDLSQTLDIDGSGIGLIAYLFKRLQNANKKLYIFNTHKNVIDIFNSFGLIKILDIDTSEVKPGKMWKSYCNTEFAYR